MSKNNDKGQPKNNKTNENSIDPSIAEQLENISANKKTPNIDLGNIDISDSKATSIDNSKISEILIERENKLKNLEENIKELKDQLLRQVAENENLRKRHEKQIEENAKFAISSFAKDLLSPLDNLFRATDFVSEENLQHPEFKNLYSGVDMTKKEFLSVFLKHKIERVEPKLGDDFDHNLHQAVSTIETKEVDSGKIADVMQSGYLVAGRLLRPAMVAVSK